MINANDEVSLSYLLDPTFELVNTAGKPITDGWIEVYIHGTRDKYYCYSDWAGTLHPFKIPLDSLGANIVLASPAHAYDVYVYNKFGNLIMSRYNVVPATGDGVIIKDIVTITSEDGTVNVSSSDQTNWDLSIQDTVDRVDEHDIVLTELATAIDSINEDLSDKKDKQSELVFGGNDHMTITRIKQNENGEITEVKYEPIDLPPQVPNVDITSPNGTIDVQSSTDVQTNTKTFTIDVKNGDPVWHYWTGNNAWTQVNTKAWTQINRPSVGAGSNPHAWNPDIKRGVYDAKAHFTVTFHNYENSKTVPNQVIQVGFRAKFVGKNNPTAIRYEDLGAWTYDPTLYTTEAYQYNYAQESLRQNHDTSKIINVANYWGDTEFNVYFEAALLNTDGSQDTPPIDTVLFAEISYFGYHEVKGNVNGSGSSAEYTAGSGIDITEDVISIDDTVALKSDIPDISNLATKSELSAVEAEIPTLPDEEEVTFKELDLSNYALASAIPDVSNLATKTELAAVEAEIPDVSNLATKSELSAVEAEIPDISNLATKTELNAVESEIPDISNLATKSELSAVEAEIPDVSNLATKSELAAVESEIPTLPSEEEVEFEELDLSDYALASAIPEITLNSSDQVIAIDGHAIASSSGPSYTAGSGIDITNNVISVDSTVAFKSEIPDVSDFVTDAELAAAVDTVEAEIPDVSNLATKATTLAGYGITNAYTKTEVDSAIDAVEAEIPDVSNLATTTYVDNSIAAIPTLSAGSGIDITNNVVSLDDPVNLVAGSNVNITVSGNDVVISAQGGSGSSSYTAGNGIDITNDTISVDNTVALKTDIPNVSNLATKTELAAVEAEIPTLPSEEEVVFEELDLSDYALASAIPDVSTFATKTELTAVEAEIPDTSDMATQTWVGQQGYLTSVPSTYATKSYVDTAVSSKQDTLTGITDVQVVQALPASPVATVLYLIPEA